MLSLNLQRVNNCRIEGQFLPPHVYKSHRIHVFHSIRLTTQDPKRLLQKDELSALFGDGLGLKVIVHEVQPLPDGRFVSAFLAQRPGDYSANHK